MAITNRQISKWALARQYETPEDILYRKWLFKKMFGFQMPSQPHTPQEQFLAECKRKGVELAYIQHYKTEKLIQLSQTKPDKWLTNIILITVNPKDIEPPKILEMWERFISQPQIAETCAALMVIEQRADYPEPWYGYHAHIFLHRVKVTNQNGLTWLRATCDRIFKPSLLHYAYPKEDQAERVIKYMVGEKANSEKHLKQKNDIPMREHFNLQKYYITTTTTTNYLINFSKKDIDTSIDFDVLPTQEKF